MKYVAYHRTSTKDQHLDRGIAELTKYCADNAISLYKGKVYTDQQTGKNFNRPRYTMLKDEILESGDVLIGVDCFICKSILLYVASIGECAFVKKLEFARTLFSTEDIQMYSIAIIRISAR